MSVNIYTGSGTGESILRGVRKLSKIVEATYGPKGRNVLLDRVGGILMSKDGISVAQEYIPANPLERIGVRTFLQTCQQVGSTMGDGTTTSLIVAASMFFNARKLVASGSDPVKVIRGIELAWQKFQCLGIQSIARDVLSEEDLYWAAMTSSGGDVEVSKALSKACMEVGSSGHVAVEDGRGIGIEVEHKPGYEIDGGWETVELGTESGTDRSLDAAFVALIPEYLETLQDVQSVVEESTQFGHPLVLISRGCVGEARATLVVNKKVVDVMSLVAAKIPHLLKPTLEDLAALTGATIPWKGAGMDFRKWDKEWYGMIQYVSQGPKKTVFEAYENDTIEGSILKHMRKLEKERDNCEFEFDLDQFSKRIAQISGGFCVMRVGGVTEMERKIRRGRIEDCLATVQESLKNGIVAGSGNTYGMLWDLLHSQCEDLDSDVEQGWKSFCTSLLQPLKVLARNAGIEPEVLLNMWKKRDTDKGPWWGWDAKECIFRDLGKGNIVCDPVSQVFKVLECAVSVTKTMLTVETAIVRIPMKRGGCR